MRNANVTADSKRLGAEVAIAGTSTEKVDSTRASVRLTSINSAEASDVLAARRPHFVPHLVEGQNIWPQVGELGDCILGSIAPLRNSHMQANVAT